MEELNYCPICGEKPTVKSWYVNATEYERYQVSCDKCGFNGRAIEFKEEESARRDWNIATTMEQIKRINEIMNEQNKTNWINVLFKTPEPFVPILGVIPNAAPFPAVRECYCIRDNQAFFPALNEIHDICWWAEMPKAPKEE